MVGKLTRLPVETQAAGLQQPRLPRQRRRDHDAFDRSREIERQGPFRNLWGRRSPGAGRAAWTASYKFRPRPWSREAAYSLIPERLRAEGAPPHREAARGFTPVQRKREEAIFEIVNQLNRGAALITSRDEREQFAELNLLSRAGAPKATTAYASATHLSGCRWRPLLPEDSWGAPGTSSPLRLAAAPGRNASSSLGALGGGGGAAPGGRLSSPRRKYGGTSYGSRALARRFCTRL